MAYEAHIFEGHCNKPPGHRPVSKWYVLLVTAVKWVLL